MMKLFLSAIFALLTCASTLPCCGAAESKRPNVLLIVIDDLNNWVGCMGGHPQTITPNLDRLAKSGMLFTNAHCAAPACNGSRTALLTGISPHVSGLYDNRQKMREVLPKAEIMPRTFSRHGYHSAGSGKLLHYFIDAKSWDNYFPQARKENPFPRTMYPDKRPLNLPRAGAWQYAETDWGPLDATDKQYGGDYLVAQWVAAQLSKPRDSPFFLACGIYRPHEPWFVPAKYFKPFPLESIQLPPGYKHDDLADLPPEGKRRGPNRYFAHIQKHKQWKQAVQSYLASIHYADTMLGIVLKALDNGPHSSDTIVALCSDHGWHLGEKQHWQKYTGWRVCTRVPMILRVPAEVSQLPGGTPAAVCDRPVSLLSIFPTLLDLCSLPAEKTHDGPSLLPLLRNPQAKWPHAAVTHLADPGSYSISADDWRMIHYANGDQELYNIKDDPHEFNNLAAANRHAARLTGLKKHAPLKFAAKPPAAASSWPLLGWNAAGNNIAAPASKPVGKPFDVMFVNNSPQPAKLYWITPQGARKLYATLAPGKQQRQQTRRGAVWLITSSNDAELGWFKPQAGNARAVIPAPQ